MASPLMLSLYVFLAIISDAASPKPTRIAFGSCIFPSLDKSILSDISDRNPDLFILSGDATYLDYRSIDLKSNLGILKGHFIGVPSDIADKTESELEADWRSIWDLTVKDPNWLKLQESTKILSVWDGIKYVFIDWLHCVPCTVHRP